MVISILAGPKFIEFLRRNEFGQQIREEGPQGHVIKQGTPAMGGLLIMLAMSLPFLIFSRHTLPALTAFFVALGCAAVGFVDDWTKIARRRSLGLAGRWKLLWLGWIFLVEALSVIVQVLSYKWFGRRVLLMAPLHHHFEMKAWSETRIMVRFWIATAILCACGFVLYYAYFSRFNSLAS